jgi:GT2 family glycosyltransferase
VTIVVPVFDDPASVERCLASVLDSLDAAVDSLVVVNDCGPEADTIEAAVLGQLAGRPGTSYRRNPRNLGFVATCNEAVALAAPGTDILLLNSDTVVEPGFVDELSAVLHVSPPHGIVCPRSNNATIASIPYYRRHARAPRSVQRARDVHDAVVDLLPRFAVTPVSMGFCFLVRRELIDEHGFFDVAFSPGYGEENDFCLRMNAHGWLSLIANRVFVAHVGAQSFRGRRGRALRAAHERRLVLRHPFYPSAVATYLQRDLDPVDRFADGLTADDALVKVLVDDRDWDRAPRSRMLSAAEALVGPELSVTVAAAAWRATTIRRRHPRLQVRRRDHLEEIFDVAIVPAGTTSASALVLASRWAVRWLGVAAPIDAAGYWRRRVKHASADAVTALVAEHSDVLVEPRDPAELLAAAAELARQPADLERLRSRVRRLPVAAAAFGRDPLRRAPLRIRVVRQLEWIAPGALELARRWAHRTRG